MKHVCSVCGYVYDEAAEGKKFEELPDDLSFDTDEYEDVIAWARSCISPQ